MLRQGLRNPQGQFLCQGGLLWQYSNQDWEALRTGDFSLHDAPTLYEVWEGRRPVLFYSGQGCKLKCLWKLCM